MKWFFWIKLLKLLNPWVTLVWVAHLQCKVQSWGEVCAPFLKFKWVAKLIGCYQAGNCSEAICDAPVSHGQSHYPQMGTTGNGGEQSANQNYSEHNNDSSNIDGSAGLTCLSEGQSSRLCGKEAGQQWHDGKVRRRNPLLTKKLLPRNIFITPPILLQKLFYGLTRQKVKTVKTSSLEQHLGKWTLSLQWWWSGAALLLQELGDFWRWGQMRIFWIFNRILKGNIRPSAHGLKLKSTWVTLQDNDLKRSSGSTLLKIK